jgi:hypothetical protein
LRPHGRGQEHDARDDAKNAVNLHCCSFLFHRVNTHDADSAAAETRWKPGL